MSDDLISKSKVIEHIAQQYTAHGEIIPEWLHIGDLPSAQPERKKGEWILTDFPDEQTYRCSSCNEHWTFLEGTPYDNGAYFCPNCGAEMQEVEE